MKNLAAIKEDLASLALPIGLIIAQAGPTLPILYVNEMFVQMLGYDHMDELVAANHGSAWNFVSPLDRDRLPIYALSRIGTSEPYEITYRAMRKDGSSLWIHQNSRHTTDDAGQELVFAYCTDISSQKSAEQALRESEFRYATAIKSSNINIWEYDYAADRMTVFSTSPKVTAPIATIPSYTKTVVEEGHIRSDSAPVLFDMIDRLKKGAPEASADLWIRQQSDGEFWCERVVYSNIFDGDGVPVRAYCVGHDVTREKEAEKRYHDELSYREAMQKATMASINVNLTRNTILDYKSIFPSVAAHMSQAQTAQEYFDMVHTELATGEMQEQWDAVFGRAPLLRSFANGETTLSLELTRKIEGRSYWTVITAHMMKKAEDQTVVAFVYSTDVTCERTMQSIMNTVVKMDYDFLVVVDAPRNCAMRYSEKSFGNTYAQESEHFEEETRNYVRHFVCPEDRDRVLAELTLQNIMHQLDTCETYSIFYATPVPDGGTCKKQLRFSYISRTLQSILMTRVDITAAVAQQDAKNKELTAAVQMAERANAAKSDFLSRISHEIRTPMNAIMGMDQLALQHLDSKGFVADCIEKSQYASQYLLQLLNDILDMSKIESGKVTLKNEVIICQRTLDSISTIIGAQAQAKGVHYHVTGFDGCRSSYLGDGVRLQQILINILSNAVKFTPAGGTVLLDISQGKANEQYALMRFQISDTGIGISEDFLPQLFDPFSQEHSGSTSSYGGSGLGLAISKNLAQLMGGDIAVTSVLDHGTIFTVTLPLELPPELSPEFSQVTGQIPKICYPPAHPGSYDFSGKNILLAEDHQLNVLVATKLLEFKNATVTVAENGLLALELFSAAPEGTYAAILMDIRMPVMDGLQAAEKIRSLPLPWAKTVPIIAMSANAFDEDVTKSKAAGMNCHLAKPISAELLYETLSEFLT